MEYTKTRPLRSVAAFFCLMAILWVPSVCAQKAYTLQTLPNPKATPSWDYVSDPDGIIGTEHESAINNLLKLLEDSTTIQMVVVAVNSIGDEPAENFATDLGEYWGVGQKETDNGVVLLLVMDQKRWQVATGYGVEGTFPDVAVVRLGETVLVPRFREGQFGAGLRAYVESFVGMMLDDSLRASFVEDLVYHPSHDTNSYSGWITFFTYYLGASVGASLLGLLWVAVSYLEKDPYKAYLLMHPAGWWLWGILFFAPYALVVLLARRVLKHLRHKPRNSPETGRALVLLSEQEDNAHLDAGRRKEEEIKSVDYDVWVVPDDRSDKLILPYRASATKYFKCSKCGYRTGYSYSETITPASYTSSGKGKKTTTCKHCSYHKVSYYTIPQKTESSSSSSSSSSGGSSFGGGSFGGGGGGGSW